MYRFPTLFALAALLAACTGGGTSPSPTDSPAAVSSPIGSPDATTEPTDGAAAGPASAQCASAFDTLGGMDIGSVSELGDLPEEVEPTIEACATVDEWIAGAQEVVADDINPNTARLLLGIQCNAPALANSDLCRDLASS